MTFLPIVEREMRVRARHRANYWGRFAVAAVGVMACVPPLVWSGPASLLGAAGRSAFNSLVSAAFVLCCAACLLTADTISAERREGTLGLLLLTRVRPVDVLLGKFASAGLTCALGLVAFLPVLVLPLLSGGVTGGEVARKALVLLNTLFLALSAGLCVSARGSDRFRSARAALLVLAALVLGPALAGLLVPSAALAGPLGTLWQAADLPYGTAPGRFWLSLALGQAAGWALLAGATLWLRKCAGLDADEVAAPLRSWPHGDQEATSPNRCAGGGRASAAINCCYCGKTNPAERVCCQECGTELRPRKRPKVRAATLSTAPTPLHWLLRRQRGLQPMLWLATVIGAGHFVLYSGIGRFVGPTLMGSYWAINLVTTAISGALIAWVASRFFVEARRSGELELLLTTPLGAEQIASTQWQVLKQRLRLPILVMLSPLLLQCLTLALLWGPVYPWRYYPGLSLLLLGVNTVFGLAAVCWLGMWFGSRVMGQGRVILWTVLLAKGLPYALSLAWWLIWQAVFRGGYRSNSGWVFVSLAPQLATALLYLWLIRLARGQLKFELAGAEPLPPSQVIVRALPRLIHTLRRMRRWPAG